ncbi:DNA repair protein RecO [Virgibacillus dakarensis]|uniref:DNA repair protein RecO n=1 Tax=Lentibacillus populi TaxID=1827502 RepID=A0A9W5TTY2_9BACI|nr:MULTISPECIES: DNA repair protein RecO [Bacillaceae]MBT2214494.1 DNA repair protein RecO [Virgibacillus dakarensis]MTW84099.1 DNA repair protein RecO [Virgibacillus dakarensis]GGB29105.1 DNA repair protein RecO [Lentibacillus populi]
MLEKVEGIIIKTQDYGETHKIVTIFSKTIGKFAAIARGAKKPKSRMAAVTQPFIHGEFLVYLNSGLSTIQQGEMLNSLRSIREDIVKTAYAAYIVELTDKLVDQKKPDHYLYNQLLLTIDWIAGHDSAEIPIIMYEMKLYQKGGFAPTVNQCVHCGSTEAPFSFSIPEGGLLCRRCLHLDNEAIPLSNKLARLLYLFSSVGLERIGNISMKEENIRLIRQLLDAYYDRFGGYYIKSKKFLKQLDKFR